MPLDLDGIAPGVELTSYTHDPLDAALAPGRTSISGPNVGHLGANLTIAIAGRSAAVEAAALIDSLRRHVADFAGEVLVATGEGGDRDVVDAALRRWGCRGRTVPIPPGAGRGAALNRLCEDASTEWVLLLSPRLELSSDPLRALQANLATLGCHFLNLPRLGPDRATVEHRGDVLRITATSDGFAIRSEPAALSAAADAEALLSTHVDLDACVVRRETLRALGGLDERLEGAEDLDLSIRVFKAGLKIGNASVTSLWRRPGGDEARSMSPLTTVLFRKKHGLSVGPAGSSPRHAPERASRPAGATRPRVALVTDTDSWAFANIARQLQRHLSDRFEFRLIPIDVMDNVDQVLLNAADCDLVHFFWRDILRLVGSPYSRAWTDRLGITYADFEARCIRGRPITTAVYDHLFLTPPEIEERIPLFRERVASYYVCSRKLERIYRAIPEYPPPAAVLEDGVDLSLFRPARLHRFDSIGDREIVVGWAGNSNWAAGVDDHKGLHSIIRPALAQLADEGVKLKAVFADRAERFVPQREMPAYYSGIDVYVCASRIEGTPNPVLESMACGVPVISTDVGIVPDAFGPEQSRFILPVRSVDALKDALRRLVAEPALFGALSRENLRSIESWDWSHKAQGFAAFFERALASAPAETTRTAEAR